MVAEFKVHAAEDTGNNNRCDSHQDGDSGGPYFYGRKGYGILSGYKWWGWHYRDSFSPVIYLDDAMNAYIATS